MIDSGDRCVDMRVFRWLLPSFTAPNPKIGAQLGMRLYPAGPVTVPGWVLSEVRRLVRR